MGTETRIGIVAGLLIVVVASVYFFFGSSSDRDDFVVATGSKIADSAKSAQPLKIPVGDGQKKPAAPASVNRTAARTPGVSNKPASPLDKAPAIARKPPVSGSGQPSALPAGPRVTTPTPSPGSGAVANRLPSGPVMGPPSGGSSPGEPQTGATPLARAEPRASVGGGAAIGEKPVVGAEKPDEQDAALLKTTVLRTGAAKELLDATRENLEKAIGRKTASALRDGSAGEGDRSTNAVSAGASLGESRPSRAEPRNESAASSKGGDRPNEPKDVKAGPSTGESRGAAGPAANPSSGWPQQHKIASGETIATLAQRYYGEGSRVSEILAANPKVDPRRLKIGDTIVIPAPKGTAPAAGKAEARSPSEMAEKPAVGTPADVAKRGEGKKAPQEPASKTYQVREGDTFYSIAKALYGNSARWTDIYQLNKAELKNDPKHLKPGMVLKLPAS